VEKKATRSENTRRGKRKEGKRGVGSLRRGSNLSGGSDPTSRLEKAGPLHQEKTSNPVGGKAYNRKGD